MSVKDYIVWYKNDGEEDYVIIKAYCKGDALDRFQMDYCLSAIECHEVDYINADPIGF